MNTRTPATPKPAASLKLKRLYKRAGKPSGGLRNFVRTSDKEAVKSLAADWFHNKTANFSKPPLGLGSTKKKKGRN